MLADLIAPLGGRAQLLRRLDVERTFEVRGTRNGAGRMYASGAATLGGYFPGRRYLPGPAAGRPGDRDDMATMGMVQRMGSGARSLSGGAGWMRVGQKGVIPWSPPSPDEYRPGSSSS